jgi:hypothetical protein
MNTTDGMVEGRFTADKMNKGRLQRMEYMKGDYSGWNVLKG